ncbi:hypothetical protein JHK82_018335 [Glycine max]|nr:hypothetical protein JHK85_018763 [Glycine max]KAG5142640.1 hypothetical protein JHK82_018335 [Glycine max]
MKSVYTLVYCDADIIPSDEGIVFESPNDPKVITINKDTLLGALRKTIFDTSRNS